jgi:hypothetical protein
MKTSRVFRQYGGNKCSEPGCKRKYHGNGYCKPHLDKHVWAGTLVLAPVATRKEKLQLYSKLNEKTGCWEWIRTKHTFGYGKIWDPDLKTKVYAHRASYEDYVGAIPQGLSVLHRCDNPTCINPDHLFLGTQGDNVRDCADKMRLRPRGTAQTARR